MFLAIISADEARQVVSEGRTGTMMPAFAREHGGELTSLQLEILIEGIKSRWAKPVADASSLPAYVGAPIASEEPADLAASEALFAKQCGSCHGPDGEGGDAGPLKVQAFLELASDQALRRIIITGRPDLKMPDFRQRAQMAPGGEPMTSAEIDQLVALMATWREMLRHSPHADQQAMR
jgi:mono/diheme cytochrome c family protein